MTGCLSQIRSAAAAIDQRGVTREVVDDLAKAGFFAATVESPPAVARELNERLAGASGSAWFVAAQHRAPAEAARTTRNDALRERWATDLARGSALGAVSFAHLRRMGPPQVHAARDGTGWRLNGRLDWITSWGLADALLLMGESDDGQVVQALLPAEPSTGLVITGPLALAAMSGTSTVGAMVTDLHVGEAEVAHILPKKEWAVQDAYRTANASPAVFGLLRSCLVSLSHMGKERAVPTSEQLAQEWSEQVRAIRSRAYTLIDEVPVEESIDERVALRAESLYLLHQVTSAGVTVAGVAECCWTPMRSAGLARQCSC
jgi:alkylation response protein AidB-like acyl-CoA dehydrogenase